MAGQPRLPQAQQTPVTSPIKGINRVMNREGQPPDTCWGAMNVLPYDSYGRRRVAQRFGVTKQFPSTIGSTSTAIQGMIEVPNIVYPGGNITVPFVPSLPLAFPGFPSTGVFNGVSAVYPYYSNTQGPAGVGFEWDFVISVASTGAWSNINTGQGLASTTMQVGADSSHWLSFSMTEAINIRSGTIPYVQLTVAASANFTSGSISLTASTDMTTSATYDVSLYVYPATNKFAIAVNPGQAGSTTASHSFGYQILQVEDPTFKVTVGSTVTLTLV